MKKKIQALCASLFMGILLFMAGVQTFAFWDTEGPRTLYCVPALLRD